MADRRHHILHLAALGVGVVDVVRDNDRQAHLPRQSCRLRHKPVVVGEKVVLQLQEERGRGGGVRPGPARGKQPGVVLRRGPSPLPIPDSQPPCDLSLAATGESHQAFRVRGQKLVAEAGHRFGAGQIRATDKTAEAAISRRVSGEQHEMRSALPFPDSPQIFLHRAAATRKPGPIRTRPERQTLSAPRVVGEWLRRRREAARSKQRRRRFAARSARYAARQRVPPTHLPPPRNHDPRRIRHGRIRQLYLYPDDRPQPRLVGRAGKANDAVQAAVVGDRQPGHSQIHGARHQLVRGGCAIQEREVRVAVKLGVGGHPALSCRSGKHLL